MAASPAGETRLHLPDRHAVAWHALSAEEVCQRLSVDPQTGLEAGEVERRRAQYGPNKLTEPPKEPGGHAFLRQYEDLMQYDEADLVLGRDARDVR